jgi:NADPH:quinone reductase
MRTHESVAWYEKQGAARDVLVIGKMDDPQPCEGEVRIRVAFSGVNPRRQETRRCVWRRNAVSTGHTTSDGSGTVDAVGDGVSREWIGRRVWCYGAQSYRPFGTAAEYTVLPLKLVVPLPEGVPLEQGACLGIPGITAHRAVHVAGSVKGQTVLVQGGAGAVGACAVQLAYRAGARVIATCRAESDKEIALRAGANEVLLTSGNLAERLRAMALDRVHHVVEVAFGANIKRRFHCDLRHQCTDAGDSGLATCLRERQTLFCRQRRCASRRKDRSHSRSQSGA